VRLLSGNENGADSCLQLIEMYSDRRMLPGNEDGADSCLQLIEM
jgi:hypothetical protein